MALPADFALLSDDAQAKWLIEDLPVMIQIAGVWPFKGIAGSALKYTSTTSALDGAETLTLGVASPSLPNQTATPAEKSFKLGELATSFEIPYAAQDQFETPDDLVATYDELAKRRLLYGFFSEMGTSQGEPDPGDPVPDGEFWGLPDLVSTANTIDMSQNPLNLAAVDAAYSKVTANNGYPNAIMSTSRARDTYLRACYESGFAPPMVEIECYDPNRGEVTVKVPSVHGTPWYVNDMLTDGVDYAGNVYFMVLGDDGGSGPTRGITGICPKDLSSSMFVRRETFNADTNNNSIKVDWTWPVGLAMGSENALAILKNFELVTDTPIQGGVLHGTGIQFTPVATNPGTITQDTLWKNTLGYFQFDDEVAFPDGTVLAPGITFSADTDTGLYNIGPDDLGFATNGTLRLSMNTTDITAALPFSVDVGLDITTGDQYFGPIGTVGDPTYAFTGHTGSGMYSDSSGNVKFAVNLGIVAQAAFTGADRQWQVVQGSVAAPGLSFINDPDTGFFTNDADTMALSLGGVEVYRWATDGIQVPDGSAAIPAFAFSSETNTGIYRVGASNLGISIANSLKFDVSATAVTSTLPYHVPDGTVGAPAYSFAGDTGTGFYRAGSGLVRVHNNFTVDSTLTVDGSSVFTGVAQFKASIATQGGINLSSYRGSVGVPAIWWDATSGFYSPTNNQIAVTISGTQRVLFATDKVKFTAEVDPIADVTHVLGTSALRWKELRAGLVNLTIASGDSADFDTPMTVAMTRSSASQQLGLSFAVANDSTGNPIGVLGQAEFNGSSGTQALVKGIQASALHSGAGTGGVTLMHGGRFVANKSGSSSGTVSTQAAIKAEGQHTGSGTVSNSYGLQANMSGNVSVLQMGVRSSIDSGTSGYSYGVMGELQSAASYSTLGTALAGRDLEKNATKTYAALLDGRLGFTSGITTLADTVLRRTGASALQLESNTAGSACALTVKGDLAVGGDVGFYGTAVAAQAPAYTPTNVTTDRSYDANATTVAELADVLGTLIADLQSYGLLQ